MYVWLMSTPVVNRFSAHAALDPTSIVGAALDIVDAEGLAALTMRRLGRELEVNAMSIYHHVPNKSAILDLLVARLLDATEAPADRSATDVVALIEEHCRRLRRSLYAHPNLSPLAAERLPPAIRSSEAVSRIVDQLVDAGFDHEAAIWIVEAFQGFAVGHTVVELAAGRRGYTDDEAAFDTGLRFLLSGLSGELGL